MITEVLLTILLLPVNQIEYREAVMASRSFSFNRSEEILNKIKRSDSEYYYYRVINNFHLNNKKETLKYIHLIENSFEDKIPIRIKATIPIIKNHVLQWKNDYDDLDDISREMLKSKNRLTNGIDKELVKNQKEIKKRLDKIIDELEDQMNKNKKMVSSDNQPSNKPLEESRIMPGNGTGEVDNRKMRVIMAEWGSLPPRKQAEALQEITRGMPARHRELTENYFRNIGKIK